MAFIAGAGLIGSLTYWLLQLATMPELSHTPSVSLKQQTPVSNLADIQAALGATMPSGDGSPETAVSNSNLILVGVIYSAGKQSQALISVAGAPAKSYKIGDEVEPGRVLLTVQTRSVTLGAAVGAPDSVSLQLPSPTL